MIQELTQLKLKLFSAYKDQQYHLLMSLDEEIRQCVTKAVEAAKRNPAEKAAVSKELKELSILYAKVVERCDEKSDALKSEYKKVANNKSSANKYLDVASGFR